MVVAIFFFNPDQFRSKIEIEDVEMEELTNKAEQGLEKSDNESLEKIDEEN